MAELPVLPDTSHVSVLSRRAFSNIDPFAGDKLIPNKRPYIFWGLLRTFRTEYILIAIIMILQTFSALSSPFALQNLLAYLETKGEGTQVRPWVWVALMFLGPASYSILFQQYYRLHARVTVHLEAILTQLVLEHSLRIRMVAEPEGASATVNSKKDSELAQTPLSHTPTGTKPSSISGDDQETDVGEGEGSTLAESNITLNTSASTAVSTPTGAASASDAKPKNLVGMMNNLISSDLIAIGNATEFMQPFLSGPCLIAGCVVFLYNILGWSAFVGVGGMVLQLPIPIWVARVLRSTTKKVTEMVSGRAL